MHIVTSELLLESGKEALAGRYHDSLVPHLNRIPGFIQETRCTSIDVPRKVLILSRWEDATAISRWRNQSDHLRIQEKAAKMPFKTTDCA